MHKPPNFEQIAERLVDRIWDAAANHPELAAPTVVVEALRQVWNARGDALVDPVTNAVDDWARAGAGTYEELQAVVEQAIKKLDR